MLNFTILIESRIKILAGFRVFYKKSQDEFCLKISNNCALLVLF